MRSERAANAPPPPIARIVETGVYVSNLRRSVAFYRDILGGTVMLDSERLVALSIGSNSVLLLFQRGSTAAPLSTPGGVVPPHGASGVQHFAFAIDADRLDAWRTYLSAAGVPIESEVHWERGGTSLYVRDPDQHSVELMTPGLWTIY